MKLTKATVAKLELPPGKKDVIVFDETLPGFGFRMRVGGKRTWVAQFRVGGATKRVNLGPVDRLDPIEARQLAKETMAKVHLGRDPQAERTKAKAEAALTVGLVVQRYIAYAEARQKPTHHADTKRYLLRGFAPLADVGLNELDRRAVSAQLAVIKRDNGPYAANRARAALSAFYSWGIGEGLAHVNPVVGSHKPVEEVSRDRILSDEELALVWKHAGGQHFGSIVRLLILTAARAMEIGGLRRDEVGPQRLKISAERSKNGRPHEIPLSSPALQVVTALPDRNRELVFGEGEGPFSGWSRAKAALDCRILVEWRKKHGESASIPPWRLHDLRRTAATRMADLGVLPHVIEAVLNHISGYKAGVAGIYNRALYEPEKRAALNLWGDHVTTLVGALQ